MDVGQVGFHKDRDVKTIRVEKRINEIVNRLNKTKVERKPDLKVRFDLEVYSKRNLNEIMINIEKAEREERDRKEREDKKRILREQKEVEKEEEKRKREMNELK